MSRLLLINLEEGKKIFRGHMKMEKRCTCLFMCVPRWFVVHIPIITGERERASQGGSFIHFGLDLLVCKLVMCQFYVNLEMCQIHTLLFAFKANSVDDNLIIFDYF